MRDDRFGVVASVASVWPDAEELRALGARCVRTVVTEIDQLEVALRDHPPDVRVIVALTEAHPSIGGDVSGASGLARWEAVVRELAERLGGCIWALECVSGWDVRGIEPATAVACASRAGRIFRAAGLETVSLLGAVSGPGWMASLHEASELLTAEDREVVGGACFQPYGRNARGFPGFDHARYEHGEIDIAVQNAHDIIRLPIWATEFGVMLRQAGGESGQARYIRDAIELLGALPESVLAAATYFCWHDLAAAPHQRNGQAFGLRREDLTDRGRDGATRAAWHAFAAAAGGTPRHFSRRTACASAARA